MKKWLALLLAAMMALALVACGDTPANNDNDNKDNDTKTEEFARGSWDGNVYTNDSLNLTVTVPDGWKIATDEELAAIMGITIDSLTEQGVSEEFLKAQNTYEMMAQDPTNGSNVIVMAENLTVSVGGTSYDEEAYSNVIINTLPEESGYEFADCHHRRPGLLSPAVHRRGRQLGPGFPVHPHRQPHGFRHSFLFPRACR